MIDQKSTTAFPVGRQTQLTAATAEAIRPAGLIPAPAGAGPSAPRAGQAASAGSAPTPYLCTACGSDSPYIGRKPVSKGGKACKACSAVEKAIHQALMATYHPIAQAAYAPGVCGDEKRAILKRATDESTKAWRAAQLGFGIGVGAVQAAADVAPAALAPRPTRVEVRYAGPMDFGVFASGGSFEDLHGAIVDELRGMVTAGLIGPGELTAVGTSLLDTAQDMALATAWGSAQVTASASDCPDCGSNNVNIFDIEGSRSYVCRDCGSRWT